MQLLILSVMLFGLALADVSHLHRGSHFGGSLNSNYHSHTGHESGIGAKMYARILKNDYLNDGHGSYNFAYETENGISHNEDGTPDNSKRGQYSYTGDDGKIYTVMYWADENGFHAVGDHLPGSQNLGTAGLKSPNGYGQPSIYNNKPKVSGGSGGGGVGGGGGNYNYPKPAVKSNGYDYAKPKQAYLPPKQAYLPPATDYLPPKF